MGATPLLTKITDPNGYATTYGYDAQGGVTARYVPSSGFTTYTYRPACTIIEQPDGSTVYNILDASNNLAVINDPYHAKVTFTRNTLGQETSRMNAVGAII